MPGDIVGAFCLSWVLALAPALGHSTSLGSRAGGWHSLTPLLPASDTEQAKRCTDTGGFDAITLDENGTVLFFQGTFVWKGFSGPAEPLNASWPEIQGPVDAALRIHHPAHPDAHDNVYLFQGKRVWAYAQGRLRDGYPRAIGEEFAGVPGDLDAAVECHPRECTEATVLFFKAPHVFSFDLKTKEVKRREWPALANCSAALRWLGRFYCFRGIHFWRFDPVVGTVASPDPKDARDYFVRCPGRGHGHETRKNATLRAIADPCSGYPFQAFSSDDAGHTYAFRGEQYFPAHSVRDGLHAWPLNHTWKGLEGEVEAAFSWEDKLYLIQGSQVTIYRAGQGYSRVEGYPRALQEELGVARVDAAFTCPHAHDAYFFQGSHVRRVDLQQSPRHPEPALPIPHDRVDGALCTAKGLFLFHGPNFHHYADVGSLIAASVPAAAQNTAEAFFRCPKKGGDGTPQQPSH